MAESALSTPNYANSFERLGFKGPTLVQTPSIPAILSGRHVLVNAATGTGKMVAYLASVVHQLSLHQPSIERSDGTLALVLVPTREHCLQVHEILQKILTRFHKIVSGCVMGGEKPKKEKARLRKGISILVATPGRLLYHLKNTASFLHSNLRWIIFDEADRILELGFGKEIQEILNLLSLMKDGVCSEFKSELKFKRQFLILSATLNENVSHLAQISLDEPGVLIGMPDMKMHSIAHLNI